MNKNLLLLAAAGIGLYFLMNKSSSGSTVDTTGYDPALIRGWIAKMKSTPDWYAAQVAEAEVHGISIEDQLTNSAMWVISQGWVM